jgi:hypothetical protein
MGEYDRFEERKVSEVASGVRNNGIDSWVSNLDF